ncbi:MAG: endonuclease III domain-containing protein [Acidobacteria bacterium]|nr:endonuclease III domain-containing protein [Acidobacteriota bacterium]
MQRAAQPLGVEPGEVLEQYYKSLLQQFGPQAWWPARTRLEVILGAILTQNTSWRNVTVAIRHLRKTGFLRWARLRAASATELEACVRPAGYFRQKVRTIQTFVKWLDQTHFGSLDALFAQPPQLLREQLIELRGLGPETADAILLYAGKQPFFVADAYTRRVLARHALISARDGYSAAQQFLHQHLPHEEAIFNEFHALLVETGKRFCKRQAPQCEGCPLQRFLLSGQQRNLVFGINGFKSQKTHPAVTRREPGTTAYGYK